MMQFDPFDRPTVKHLKFQKFKMAAAAILKNCKIAISRPLFDRGVWSVTNLRSKEIQYGGGRHPNNLTITICRQRFEQPSDFSIFT